MQERKEAFVTIFDSNFLPQGLLLYDSLTSHTENFTLWVCCLDDKVYDYLTNLNLENANIFNVENLENKQLLEVKGNRSAGEYAWTLTPYLPSYIFSNNNKIHRVTYLDADLWFLKNPQIILEKFSKSNKAILLTPHDFQSNQDLSSDVGKYCVQFLTVTREARLFLTWWQNLCLEWCFSSIEPNRFGDQKYLDLVPSTFPNLFYELSETQLTQGPWNTNKFNPRDAVFYHFHGLRIKKNKILVFTVRRIKRKGLKNFYIPYIRQIKNIFKKYGITIEITQTDRPASLKEIKMLKAKISFIHISYFLQRYKSFRF